MRAVPSLSETESSARHSTTGEVFAQASYNLALSSILLAPYVALDHVSSTTDAFAEQGGIAALSGSDASFARTYALIGTRASLSRIELGRSRIGMTPHVSLGWSHAFDGAAPGETLTYKTGQSFKVLGASNASDAALVSAAVDFDILSNLSFTLGYDGSFSSRSQTHTAKAAIARKF